MAQVRQEDLGQIKEEIHDLKTQTNVLSETVKQQNNQLTELTKSITILSANMEGTKSRIINKLWGIVLGSVALGVAVLGFFISLMIDSKSPQITYYPPTQTLLREMIRAELSALPTTPPSKSSSQNQSAPPPNTSE